ncbi:MAG: putative toxin-antitoxin system toxin component, PIN family [Bacteroidetes bacterium]|nr:MAG: putative toxin-antitoxin system toxin component, PIN family [Bacteroidota bacterium]
MRINPKSRIVVDTNLWISFLISKTVGELENIIYNKNLIVLFSEELNFEIDEVIKRPKFRKYFSSSDVNVIHEIQNSVGENIDIKSQISICRDIKDNFLLSLCRDGKADFLITGDSDLLIMEKFEKTLIINYRKFYELG